MTTKQPTLTCESKLAFSLCNAEPAVSMRWRPDDSSHLNVLGPFPAEDYHESSHGTWECNLIWSNHTKDLLFRRSTLVDISQSAMFFPRWVN